MADPVEAVPEVKETANIDASNLYHQWDRVVDGLQKSTSSNANGYQNPDLQRLKDWGKRMRNEVMHASREPWDIVNIDPTMYPFQPKTAVKVQQNSYTNHLVSIAVTARDMVVHSDSCNYRNGLSKEDAKRQREACDEWDAYITDVIEKDMEPDIPGTNNRPSDNDQTGPNT